jgi:hypothetical protein
MRNLACSIVLIGWMIRDPSILSHIADLPPLTAALLGLLLLGTLIGNTKEKKKVIEF